MTVARRTIWRFIVWVPIVVLAAGAVLVAYYVYAPPPEVPRLSGTLTKGSIAVDGRRRTYILYTPRSLKKGAAVVVAMHGSGTNGAHMRTATGYGFDRLADEHGFAVVYPDAYEGYWNACNIVGNYSANKLNIDDVRFLTTLVDKLATEIGVDRDRAFAVGSSRGGQMAIRLALEAPSHFRGLAAVSANVPTPDNFKCTPTVAGTPSVMIMNGTKDPLNPFDGGEVRLFGLYARGTVRSSRASAHFFADLNNIKTGPQITKARMADGVSVEYLHWGNPSSTEVELIAIYGGGHVMPQPYWRYPRLLGPTPKAPNGPAVIWAFFERQRQKREDS